ncbi:ABC transporter permease [Halorarius halobius]|uniref:ABC transporter permease n=1 Tax=Halorarius halobius TaxID=2962671 RepID=UPI0020CC7486|nr:ABC transporter permease subunit [Halorarius halobius]
MFEITAFEVRRRVRGTLYFSVALLAYAALVLAIFPSIKEAAVDIESYIENLPPEIQRAFVGEASSYTTIEGFLASEMYQFVFLLVLGMYFAYAAASTVASEVENGSIGPLLANPVSRTRVLVGKYLSLVPSIAAVNAVLFAGTYYGTAFIGEDVSLVDLATLHALSVPYLLACAGLGMVASVSFDSARRAQTVGAGGVFAMFLVDAATFDTDYEWLGDMAFSRYFDTAEILVDADVDWAGTAYLLVAAVALVVVSAELFERADLG